MWHIFLWTSIISYSLSTVLQKILLKKNKSDPIAYAIVFQLLVAIAIGFYAIVDGIIIPSNIVSLIPNIILATILYALGNIFLFKSLKLIDASEFTVLFITRGIWIVLTAIIFLHESFSLIQGAGTMLVLASVVVVTYKKHAMQLNKGAIYALLAASFFGIAFPNDAYIVKSFNHPITYSFIVFLLPGIALALFYPRKIVQAQTLFTKDVFPRILLLSLIYAVFGVTILLAYKFGGDASQIGAISQISTIITVLLSIFFLKETTDIWKKVLGAVLGFLGVILIK